MSTPTDPYNSSSRRPFDDDDSILEPLPEPAEQAEAPHPLDKEEAAADGHDEPAPDAASPAESPSPWAAEAPAPTDRPEQTEQPADLPAPAEPVAAAQPEHRGPTRTSVMSATTIGAFAAAPSAAPTAASPDSTASPATTISEPAFIAATDTDERRERWSNDPGDDVLTEDIPAEPKKRGLAHVGTFFLTLLLLPVAWYFISDAGARLAVVPGNPWLTGSVQLMPLGELLAGIVVVGVIWLAARASSLGAQVLGTIVFLAGAAALVVPQLAQNLIAQLNITIGSYNAFTGNVVYHLTNDLASGRLAVFGALLLLTGLVAHGSRRRGQTYATALTRRHYLLKESDAS
ncbi:hypothetical protein [Trueperella pyogenes]|uniref:Uncharacterized protein n=1 Tax=Trueperella pyogenes TaxID=1661 RepID=A0A3Q9GG85_9ACTO|nr:hypothetical protein [Trueperella pyogenes]AWG03549.1 hypothetical protein DC090_03360 [Trueperella pyogenes]AWG16280.1 hypothetical protein DDE06_05290 [Trueperella pyogenes]AZR05160.1 hypothetical protein EBQ11_07890 [Trueperella pyogenes]AZR07212.1 hypothetical protein EBQ10_07845 [Trueperella pyogenes]MCI7689564.1 hypothetical protein [Trueperella pyogenes]